MLQAVRYAFEAVQSEAQHLVSTGAVRRSEPIAHLQSFFPEREWQPIAEELMLHEYDLHDAIADLLATQEWSED